MINEKTIREMLACATQAKKNAFVIRSGHKLGACVLTSDGELYSGCNTESIVMGLGLCAEQSAINHAVAHGKYQFRAVAVVDTQPTLPCGVCLQYLMQFFQIDQHDIAIIAASEDGGCEITSQNSGTR